jgi:hypothetical protein
MSDALNEDRKPPASVPTAGIWRRARQVKSSKPLSCRLIESAAIFAAITLVYLGIGELALRVVMHAPLTDWRDFRHERAVGTINRAVEFDSALGWRLRPHLKAGWLNTLDYGFRSNGNAETRVQPGGVLAVGSSFTVGSEVNDDQSWPAHLQQLTGWNVNNAGQGGYQADQIVLLAEQLLPLIRPQAIVVDLIPDTIIGTGYASSGWPKPYFTIENDELVIHNSPVPQNTANASDRVGIKWFLGHFAALDRFMAAFFANFWFTADGSSLVTVTTDEVGVTCRLLARLKQKTDAADVRLLLYLQYGGLEVVDSNRVATSGWLFKQTRWAKSKIRAFLLGLPPGAPNWDEASQRVGICARDLGINTIDELPALRAVYDRNPPDLHKYYQIEPDGSMGHKSAFGNRDVAERIAASIGEFQLPGDQKSK